MFDRHTPYGKGSLFIRLHRRGLVERQFLLILNFRRFLRHRLCLTNYCLLAVLHRVAINRGPFGQVDAMVHFRMFASYNAQRDESIRSHAPHRVFRCRKAWRAFVSLARGQGLPVCSNLRRQRRDATALLRHFGGTLHALCLLADMLRYLALEATRTSTLHVNLFRGLRGEEASVRFKRVAFVRDGTRVSIVVNAHRGVKRGLLVATARSLARDATQPEVRPTRLPFRPFYFYLNSVRANYGQVPALVNGVFGMSIRCFVHRLFRPHVRVYVATCLRRRAFARVAHSSAKQIRDLRFRRRHFRLLCNGDRSVMSFRFVNRYEGFLLRRAVTLRQASGVDRRLILVFYGKAFIRLLFRLFVR